MASAPAASTVAAARQAPDRGLSVEVVRGVEALAPHTAAWTELAQNAADPNPFYEPAALTAALALLPEGKSVEVALVWAQNPLPKQPPLLVGLMPFVRHARWKGLPLAAIATWKHLYAYLGTPLVRAEEAAEVLDAIFAWARTQAALVVWDTIASDTAFRHALTDATDRHALTAFTDERHTRAVFRPAVSAGDYLARALSGKKHRELHRQEKRLGERGELAYEDVTDIDAFVDEFLALEARGWKAGSSMQGDPTARELFRAYCRGGRAQAWTLRVGGRAIAMKVNLRAGDGALAFKIAYDEELAKFSPGVLLELEHVRRLHAPGAPRWVDSGAAANHPMINHLWRDRLGIETVVTSTGGKAGALALAALPLVRYARATLRSLRKSHAAT